MNFEYAFQAWNRYLKENPSAIVLSDSLGSDLTRDSVEKISGQVYGWLKKNGIGKGDFVLINLDRGVGPVLAIMGVWKAGAAFTVVESTYAKDRIEYIRNDWQPKIEINESAWYEILNAEYSEGYVEPDDHDVCLGVYTSGTTGNPKGVLHEFGQLKMEMISEQDKDGHWRENEKTKWGLVAPLNFVASLKIVVHFLYCGGHLYVMDYDTVKNSRALGTYFLKNKINETFLSPSLLKLRNKGFGPFMKFIYTGAEPANNVFVKGVELNNTYTMSESFFTVSEFILDKSYPICPIGNPKFDLDIRLIDEFGNDVPEGQNGEFCFYNPYCRGYINNDRENAIHFIDGWFHTGDMAVYENGQYYLKGRSDDMIKIDGNRIEPAEIESACIKTLGINHCVAKGFSDKGAVVVYYTDQKDIDIHEAQTKLKEILPYYMIPATFVKIDKIPLNKSAKVDRGALAFPAIVKRTEYVAPRNTLEEKIATAFEKTLGITKVGIDDDFFELGGNSIKAIETIDLLEKRLSNHFLSAELIYEGRTIRNIMTLHADKGEGLTSEEKETARRQMETPLRHFSAVIYPVIKAFPEATTFNLYSGLRIKKSFLLRGSKLVKAVNSTIRNNSQLQTVVKENSEGIPCWIYAPECYPEIKLEKMADCDALDVGKTFVRGFDAMDKELYRIRIIESRHYIYLYADFNHVLINGGGLNLLMRDIVSSCIGKINTDNRFYEWLYDLEETVSSEKYDKTDDYFNKKYLPYIDNMHFVNKGKEGREYIKKMYPLPFDLKILKEHEHIYNVTNSIFLNTAFLCAMATFNQQKNAGILWAYDGYEGKKNHCGFTSKAFPLIVSYETYNNLNELYADVKDQVNQELKRGYYFFDYDSTFAKQSKNLNMNLDYLGDMESMGQFEKFNIEKLDIVSPHDTDIESNYVIAQVLNADHGFDLRLWHPVSELTQENAEIFVDILRDTIAKLLSGNIPSFVCGK